MQAPTLSVPGAQAQATPTPLQNLRPPPEAFGANVAGQALNDLGAVATQHGNEVAQYATTVQGLNNKQAADSAYVDTSSTMNNFVEDYQAKNRGMAAFDKSQDAFTALADLRQKGEAGLSPLALIEYQANSRRALQYAQSTIRSFANAQRYTSLVDTNKATIATAQGQAVASDDDTVLNNSLATIGATNASMANIQGWSPETAQYELHKSVGAIFEDKVKVALDTGDYPTAKAIVAAHRDDMTPDQLVSVMGSLKVGGVSFQANTDRAAWRNGVPAVTTSTPTPEGKWDAGVATFRANPAQVIGDLVGAPVEITSGFRTPAQNASLPNASPTSEHMGAGGSAAWDFKPTKGNLTSTAVTLAANMHNAGLPFDQIEVDSSNGHVHVGFGPKNRNEVIDQNGHQLSQSAPVPQNAGAPPRPSMTAQTDPNVYLDQSESAASSWVAARYPDNPVQQNASLSAIRAEIGKDVQQLRAQQTSVYNQAADLVSKGNLQSTTSIPPSLLAAMSPAQRRSIEADTNRNATELTDERLTTASALNAQAKLYPEEFASTDLYKYDLTRNQRVSLLNAQNTINAKQQKAGAEDKVLRSDMNDFSVNSNLTHLGITKAKTPNAYYQVVGKLDDLLTQAAQANNNKRPAPGTKEFNAAVAQTFAYVGAKPGGIFGIGGSKGTPAFQVPPATRAKMTAARLAAGLPTDPLSIERAYIEGSRSGTQ